MRDIQIQTIYQQTTPFQNPIRKLKAEITVIDPRHPLFNRRFQVLSSSDPHFSQGHVYVIYREGVTLRIPFSATDILDQHFSLPSSKLTASSIREIVSLAEQCNLLRDQTPVKFGNDSHPRNTKKCDININLQGNH